MRLRHLLLSILCLSLQACASGELVTQPPETQTRPVASAILSEDWNRVLKLTKDSQEPIFQLVRLRALYELGQFKNVRSQPKISKTTYQPYETFLRTLAAQELKAWKSVIATAVPDALPSPLQEQLVMARGDALHQTRNLIAANKVFRDFLNDFKSSSFRSDILLRLADIEWDMGRRAEAIKLYETVYQYHPTHDSDDIALQRLVESGRFQELDTSSHLVRIQQLRRATLFRKAEKELEQLQKKVGAQEKSKVDLAYAQLLFAQKKYRAAELLARKMLKPTLSPEMEIKWRELLAQSLSRQAKHPAAEKHYEILLSKKIPNDLREVILLRLGALALDERNFKKAADRFLKLRETYSRGRYNESAHWFEAWSRYQAERRKKNSSKGTIDKPEIEKATALLDRLPDLREGKGFTPQALYWRSRFAAFMDDGEREDAMKSQLHQSHSMTYYSLLLRTNPFSFLESSLITSLPDPRTADGIDSSIARDLNWQRVESFRSVGLHSWAKMELNEFMNRHRRSQKSFRELVASRLAGIRDWADLVRWTAAYTDKGDLAKNLDDPSWQFLYPRAFEDEVRASAREFDVSPFLIWGVMREESRFESEVKSIAGAVGLMQLMPFLANRIGKQLNEGPSARRQLTDPKRNIRYGAFHLAELKTKTNALPVPDELKPVLVIAAYNAGIEAVRRWIHDHETSDVDVFVESIPFTETRLYVKRVLESAYIYYRLYGGTKKSFAEGNREESL